MEQDNLLTSYHTLSENLDRLQEELFLLAGVIAEHDKQIAYLKTKMLGKNNDSVN